MFVETARLTLKNAPRRADRKIGDLRVLLEWRPAVSCRQRQTNRGALLEETDRRAKSPFGMAPSDEPPLPWLGPRPERKVIERPYEVGSAGWQPPSGWKSKRLNTMFLQDQIRRRTVRRARRCLPASRLDRDDRCDLTGIPDQHKAWRHLAKKHEVRPRHLPGFLDHHHVERVIEFDQAPLRRRRHDDTGTRWKLLLVGQNLNAVGDVWCDAALRNEADARKFKVPDQPTADVVGLRSRLRGNRDPLLAPQGLLNGLKQQTGLARPRWGLYHSQPLFVPYVTHEFGRCRFDLFLDLRLV